MLSKELISPNMARLKPADTVAKALQLADDLHVKQLPVVEDGHYLGLVHEDDLLDADDDRQPVANLAEHYSHPLVFETDHFLKAVHIIKEQQLTVVPVLTPGREYAGAITAQDLLRTLAGFVGSDEPGAMVVLEVEKRHFSFSELSRLIETHDAHITQLNTDEDPETGMMMVTVKINKTEVSDIVGTLQRFDYTVVYYQGEENYENEMRSNYDNLMNYLNI
jgi:acetoin utilization protein AcuB